MGKMAANDRGDKSAICSSAQFIQKERGGGVDQENELPRLAGLFYDEEPMKPGRFFHFH